MVRGPWALSSVARALHDRVMAQQAGTTFSAETLEWLLAGDPAIRWQTKRDLLDAAGDEVDAERARVATTGWGRMLLGHQDPAGTWGGGLYSPKWTSTTYTLLLLRHCGLARTNPAALRGVELIWDGARYFDGGLTCAASIDAPEACVTSIYITLGPLLRLRRPPRRRRSRLAAGQPVGRWRMELPYRPLRRPTQLVPHLDPRARSAGRDRRERPWPDRHRHCAQVGTGVLPRPSSLPVPPRRNRREPGVHEAVVPAPLALRPAPRARPLPAHRRRLGRPIAATPSRSSSGAAASTAPGQCRTGTPGRSGSSSRRPVGRAGGTPSGRSECRNGLTRHATTTAHRPVPDPSRPLRPDEIRGPTDRHPQLRSRVSRS